MRVLTAQCQLQVAQHWQGFVQTATNDPDT
jgi:hypothetical protein